MLIATDFNNYFFLFRIVLSWCRLCLPSASWVNAHNTPWPTIFHPSCSLTAALRIRWLCSPLYSGGHTQGTEQGCSHTPTVNRDSISDLKSSLEATLKGRIDKADLLRRYNFFKAEFWILPLLYSILYGIKPKPSIPYWKQMQKSSKVIQVSLETEIFSDAVPSFDLVPVLLFIPLSALSDICFVSKLILSGFSAKTKRHTEPIQWQYAI